MAAHPWNINGAAAAAAGRVAEMNNRQLPEVRRQDLNVRTWAILVSKRPTMRLETFRSADSHMLAHQTRAESIARPRRGLCSTSFGRSATCRRPCDWARH